MANTINTTDSGIIAKTAIVKVSGFSNNRKKTILRICALIMVLYFVLPLPFVTDSQEIAIQKSAFRFLYESEHYGHKDQVTTFYVQIGKGGLIDGFADWGNRGGRLELKDPSGQLLCALNDFPITVKPGSLLGTVEGNEVDAPDRERSKDAVCFAAGPIIKSLGLARCRTFYDGGGLCAAEYESFFIRTPFGWKHIYSFMLWVS